MLEFWNVSLVQNSRGSPLGMSNGSTSQNSFYRRNTTSQHMNSLHEDCRIHAFTKGLVDVLAALG